MRPSQPKFLLALVATAAAFAAAAAQWEPVAVVEGDRIEVDKSRIVRQGDGVSTAWSRLALDRDMIDEHGMRYTAIEALNRYDCGQRSFATIKRVYRRDARTVREEAVAGSTIREMAAEAGSADEKLLAEVCKPRTPAEVRAALQQPRQAAVPRPAKPMVMYADMRTADAAGRAAPATVAQNAPAAAKPAEKTADAPVAEARPERPRFIELPKIDKSQLEDPLAGAAKPTPADGKPAATKAAKTTTERASGARSEIERLYATSGPRRTVQKKATASPDQTAAIVHKHIHWAYEGEGGPAHWDKLRQDYAICGAGKRQSPIDIRDGIKVDLEKIAFDYKPSHFRITDNGHTIQVDVGEGSSIRVMERDFQLVQFHFHRPAEERIGGKGFDMVVHFVHKDFDGKLAVVAVLLERGAEQPLIQTLWNNMPLERGHSIEPATIIDPAQLLPPPDRRAYYTYMGSLTTPPCTEDVLWMVFQQPLQVSPQQISIFSRLYANNARPLQPANGRLIKGSR